MFVLTFPYYYTANERADGEDEPLGQRTGAQRDTASHKEKDCDGRIAIYMRFVVSENLGLCDTTSRSKQAVSSFDWITPKIISMLLEPWPERKEERLVGDNKYITPTVQHTSWRHNNRSSTMVVAVLPS